MSIDPVGHESFILWRRFPCGAVTDISSHDTFLKNVDYHIDKKSCSSILSKWETVFKSGKSRLANLFLTVFVRVGQHCRI